LTTKTTQNIQRQFLFLLGKKHVESPTYAHEKRLLFTSIATAWQQHGNCRTAIPFPVRQDMCTKYCNCMATAWQQHGNCIATALSQFHFLTFTFTFCMATAWQQLSNCFSLSLQSISTKTTFGSSAAIPFPVRQNTSAKSCK